LVVIFGETQKDFGDSEMYFEGDVACMGEMRTACGILVRKPETKRSLSRPRCRWKVIKRSRVGWYELD
jgi:hypothetical protein